MSETWYKCLECGEVFPVKTPHCHGNQYRKRKIPWEAVEMPKSYAELEAEVKRLRDMIVAFCDAHAWTSDVWKLQPDTAPLFVVAEEVEAAVRKGGGE